MQVNHYKHIDIILVMYFVVVYPNVALVQKPKHVAVCYKQMKRIYQ